jgi:hypothetical protein
MIDTSLIIAGKTYQSRLVKILFISRQAKSVFANTSHHITQQDNRKTKTIYLKLLEKYTNRDFGLLFNK